VSPPIRLVLFDVDGTLLTCGRRTRPLLGRALTEVFGAVPGIESYGRAGAGPLRRRVIRWVRPRNPKETPVVTKTSSWVANGLRAPERRVCGGCEAADSGEGPPRDSTPAGGVRNTPP